MDAITVVFMALFAIYTGCILWIKVLPIPAEWDYKYGLIVYALLIVDTIAIILLVGKVYGRF